MSPSEDDRRAAVERARRRRRLEEVFGGSPSQTRDDLADPGDPADRRTDVEGEDRLRREVPPHHGTP